MNNSADTDELRLLVRRALLDMLHEHGGAVTDVVDDSDAYRLSARPAERSLTVTLHGSDRSIGLLEEAFAKNDTSLEIAVGTHWGPKVRVRADPR